VRERSEKDTMYDTTTTELTSGYNNDEYLFNQRAINEIIFTIIIVGRMSMPHHESPLVDYSLSVDWSMRRILD
jgi:hypothetical protein